MIIEILSTGSVSPVGVGKIGSPEKCPEISLVGSSATHPVALVDKNAPEILKWSKEPRLRRASPISYYLIEAANQALAPFPDLDRTRIGVVVAFFLGCIDYSVKFYRQITTEGRRYGSPILFPETVFNTPISHVVATLGIKGPVYSQIGDKSAWVTALRTAECWMKNGSADHVIVLGAEEFDPHVLDALHASRLLKKGLPIAEGAGAVLLSSKGNGSRVKLASAKDGYCFANRSEAIETAVACLSNTPHSTPILSTSNGWNSNAESFAATGREWLFDKKLNCEAFTASAAWETIRGIQLIQELQLTSLVIPHWGITQQSGVIHLVR